MFVTILAILDEQDRADNPKKEEQDLTHMIPIHTHVVGSE